jgi:putative Ca2+/H+ antiporter (TMEM165/GDT1 family)
MRYYAAIFLSVFLAELGDKTQLATLLYASNPGLRPAGVFAASSLALTCSSLVAVLVGRQFSRWLPSDYLTVAAGVIFIAIGAVILARWRIGA